MRYFIINYTGNTPQGQATGLMWFKTDGKFPSRAWINETIKNDKNLEVQNPVLTGITELTASDYNDWIAA